MYHFNCIYCHLLHIICKNFIKMYSLVSEIWKFKDHQFVSLVASTENPSCFVLAAVSWVINRTIVYNEILLVTILHCNIYLALKYLEKLCFPLWTTSCWWNISINGTIVCATCGYISAANLLGSCCIHRSTMKYTKLIHFILQCLVFHWSLDYSVP